MDSVVFNEQTARQWLHSENLGLNGRPIDLIRQAEGLVRVFHYLDASRGLVSSLRLARPGVAHGRVVAHCHHHEAGR